METTDLFETTPGQGPSHNRIFYLCNWQGESGGIKVLYDHVRLLRQAGVDAQLGSYGEFQRCSWFEHDPREIPAVSRFLATLRPTDTVVLPEFCMRDRELSKQRCRQMVFVQNANMLTGSIHLPRYEAVMVPSRELFDWVRESTGYAGEIRVVQGALERELVLAPRRFTRSRPRVLIVDRPDKHRGEPARVRDALCDRGFDVTFASQREPRRDFVQRFVDHDVYLHLSYPEGFPISILEAFGAGCLVIGFAGRGGLEFMDDRQNCFVMPDGDWQAVLRRLLAVRATSLEPTGLESLDRVLDRGRQTALRYPESEMSERLCHGLLRDATQVSDR